MKRFLFLALACIVIANVYGADFVSSDYNRNSLSVILLEHGDQYDSQVSQIVSAQGIPEKYDANEIETQRMRTYSARTQAISADDATRMLTNEGVARQILSYEFSRQSDGTMSDALILSRGNYNATDQDYVNAMATKVGKAGLSETGYALLSSSYVACMDFYQIYSKVGNDNKVTWNVNVAAHVYRVALTEEILNYIYDNCWIYDDDSESVKQAKRSAFEKYGFSMDYVTTAVASSSDEHLEDAIAGAYAAAYTSMESLMSAWQVATTIQTKRPLSAKIGTKESLKNGDRYRAYSYRQNNNGEIVSVKHGYLRATEIANNSTYASGDMAMSKFYQISGVQDIQPGWAIKQSHDMKFGVGISYAMGGISKSSMNLDLDYLANIGRLGCITYILVGAGFDVSGELKGASNYKVDVGVGYGIPLFTRQIELMPYASVGIDNLSKSSSSSSRSSSYSSSYSSKSSSSSDSSGKTACYMQCGGRLMVTIWYPVQVYAKAGYDVLFGEGSIYKSINNSLKDEYKHKSGFGFGFGVRIAL